MKKVIIIGAGTAGLAAGIRLKTLGFNVDIYEKNEKVGEGCIKLKNKVLNLMLDQQLL